MKLLYIVLKYGVFRRTPAAILAGALFLSASAANAAPVVFAFSGTLLDTTVQGTSTGQSYEISIFADNGTPFLSQQTWGGRDYLSAAIDIGNGAYTMSFDQALADDGLFVAQTDILGNIFQFFLLDFGPGNTDSLGGTNVEILVGGEGVVGFSSIGSTFMDTGGFPGSFTASLFVPTPIPLPAALPLFLTGLAGLALIRRRQRQAHNGIETGRSPIHPRSSV